jgi:hypothetical protein
VGTHSFTVRVVERLQLDDIRVADDAHNLQLTILNKVSDGRSTKLNPLRTLNRLSCNTRLIAASSPEGESFVWKTTPKLPLPTILHCVYCISRVSPVTPSWTFSRMTSVEGLAHVTCKQSLTSCLTSHPQTREGCRPILRHLEVQNNLAIATAEGWRRAEW